jgi:hypothetical protein
MSKHELVEAYIRGRIGRREFIKRLQALGISSAAALVYAQALASTTLASGVSRNEMGLIMSSGVIGYGYGRNDHDPGNDDPSDDPTKNSPPPGEVIDKTNLSAGCDPIKIEYVAGGAVRVICAEGGGEQNGNSAALLPTFGFRGLSVSADPDGLHQVVSGQVFLQAIDPPNTVNLIVHYTDDEVAGIDENTLRLFYDAGGVWVEMPVTIDTAANTATVTNVDVSAFGGGFTALGLYAP